MFSDGAVFSAGKQEIWSSSSKEGAIYAAKPIELIDIKANEKTLSKVLVYGVGFVVFKNPFKISFKK